MTLAVIFKYILDHWRPFAIGLGAFVLLIIIAVSFRSCKSATEKRIEDRQPVIVEQQQGANQAINQAINANQDAQNAQNEVNRVQRDKQTNVSIETANKSRCAAFPMSEGCR